MDPKSNYDDKYKALKNDYLTEQETSPIEKTGEGMFILYFVQNFAIFFIGKKKAWYIHIHYVHNVKIKTVIDKFTHWSYKKRKKIKKN